MRTATEELVRRATPVTTIGRIATEGCEFGSQQIASGDPVLLGWVAANHDPAAFENSDETNLTRWPNRHLSFGLGPHRCIGSNVARAMFRIATRAILRRMPDFRVTEHAVATDRSTHNAFTYVDVEFTPGARSDGARERPAAQFQDWGKRFGKRRVHMTPGVRTS
jgi:cytochrome P450